MTKGKIVNVIDKFGHSFDFTGEVGERISILLRRVGLPQNAVVVFKDGKIVSEDTCVLEEEGKFNIKIIRNYDVCRLWKIQEEILDCKDAIYSKPLILHLPNGDITRKIVRFNESTLKKFVESKFTENVKNKKMIEEGDKIAIGFSGGADSTSLLFLFLRLKDQLPPFEILPVTVTGVPDVDPEYTKIICKDLKLKQKITTSEQISDTFNIKLSYIEALEKLLESPYKVQALYVGHHIIRRMIEIGAADLDVTKLTLGLEEEEFISAALGSYTTGHILAGWHTRKLGKFTYIYPLYNIPKKEIELYHHFTIHYPRKLSTYSIVNVLAPLNRALYMNTCDHIQENWPGIEHHMYVGYEKLFERYFKEKLDYTTCDNCGATIIAGNVPSRASGLCDVCQIFDEMGWITR